MYNNEIIQNDIKEIVSQDINFEKWKNKGILITGATGMLATYFMYVLMYLNDKFDYKIKIFALVRNIDSLKEKTNYTERNDIIPVVQDVCSNININEKIDYIIHMAGSADPKSFTQNPIGVINANIIGSINVLELARKNNAKVLFTSTREIYGKVEKENIDENDMGELNCTEVRSCYPESKRMAENIFCCYSYQYGVIYKIARIAHSYGPGMAIKDDGRIMADLISDVVNSNDIVLKSNGEAKRAFCYISDAISALFRIIFFNDENEIYNVANETEEISIKDLAYKLEEEYKNKHIKVVFKIQENKNQYLKFERRRLNTAKLESIGWKPMISLEEGINRTVKYFESIQYGK